MFRLVPNSGIQFFDFEFNVKDFRSIRFSVVRDERTLRFSRLQLHEDGESYIDESGRPVADDDQVSGSVEAALRDFAGQWLPLPFFRNDRTGPLNWARAYFPRKQRSADVKIVLVFDTTLGEHESGRALEGDELNRIASLMPVESDVVAGETTFGVPKDHEGIRTFFEQRWVGDWIKKSWVRPERINPEAEEIRNRKALANYLALLYSFGSSETVDFPRCRFIDNTADSTHRPIDVDLVLDIGNSRTFGLLIEDDEREPHVDLTRSYPLEFRDISQPDQVHNRPFESRVEFCKPFFGPANLSRLTGRRSAFQWPSAVRIGDEAVRLSHEYSSVNGVTGMSSPKRYLWSRTPVSVEWRFNSGGRESEDSALDTGGYFRNFAADGEYLADVPDALPAVTASFSRSSVMTFFLMELLLQVLREINSPSRREKQGQQLQARRLRRIVLTMPTAMTRPERSILRRRVETAIKEVWQGLNFAPDTQPKLQMQWDEASATQAVFVYNEVVERFFGDTASFMYASSRPEARDRPLRIVSLDIGGGTSDLIISSYRNDERSLTPRQEFREGFQCAGDDIVKAVIENHVIPALTEYLAKQDVPGAKNFVVSRLGAVRAGESAKRLIRRQQFSQQVLTPFAYWLLEAHEGSDRFGEDLQLSASWDRVFGETQPTREVLDHICEIDGLAEPVDLSGFSFSVTSAQLTHTVYKVMEPFIDCLAEATYYFDCDFMLLAGRPSRFPALRAMIAQRMPVMPERIVTMHDYEVGAWYPFRNFNDEIGDPKTCAAVGAMICALSEGQLNDFHMRTSELTMRSTARYIGQMNQGRIREDQLLFRNVDMEQDDQSIEDAVFRCHPPVALGFRQLDLDRWPATMLYNVTLSKSNLERDPPSVMDVTLTRLRPEDDPLEKLFEIEAIVDGNKEDLPRGLVRMNLQTMVTTDVHWAESGSFNLGGMM
ncbi:virulence factor SrfB [Mameliella alba]|uniref:virulence factor SrfB n=2 Tax=Mameliella alba TaxID=561184 RepID=UPI003012A505